MEGAGPRTSLVRRLNIDGDAQGDLAGHGGEQRAVFVYQMDSYRYWERELKRRDLGCTRFTFAIASDCCRHLASLQNLVCGVEAALRAPLRDDIASQPRLNIAAREFSAGQS